MEHTKIEIGRGSPGRQGPYFGVTFGEFRRAYASRTAKISGRARGWLSFCCGKFNSGSSLGWKSPHQIETLVEYLHSCGAAKEFTLPGKSSDTESEQEGSASEGEVDLAEQLAKLSLEISRLSLKVAKRDRKSRK